MRKRMNPMHQRILKEIEAKIRIYPGYADLTNQMGILLMKGGDLKDAKRHFLKALLRISEEGCIHA